MDNTEILSDEMLALLAPRENLSWGNEDGFMLPWAKPVLIENEASRAFLFSVFEQEHSERSRLLDQVEGALTVLSSKETRFWRAEFIFMAQFLTLDQQIVYAHYFLNLTETMPKKLVLLRRRVVQKYVQKLLPEPNSFVVRQCRKFVRSSVLLYPSYQLTEKALQFQALMKRSQDQTRSANRKKTEMSIRALQLLSDQEICRQYRSEDDYFRDLEFLKVQSRYLKITEAQICSISLNDLQEFWAE